MDEFVVAIEQALFWSGILIVNTKTQEKSRLVQMATQPAAAVESVGSKCAGGSPPVVGACSAQRHMRVTTSSH